MSDLREAAEMALEALEAIKVTVSTSVAANVIDGHDLFPRQISALSRALEEPENSTKVVVDTETPICTPQYTEMLRLRKQEAIESCARLTMSSDDWLAETIAVAATWQTDQEGRFIGAGIDPDLAIHIARFILEVKAKQGTKQEPVGYADKYDLEREGHDFWVSRQEGKHTVPLYAKQYKQETVGWATITNGYPSMWVFNPEYVKNNPNTTVTLYTTPPKREWVGLTDEEIRDIHWSKPMDEYSFARAIEAKLKEKNT